MRTSLQYVNAHILTLCQCAHSSNMSYNMHTFLQICAHSYNMSCNMRTFLQYVNAHILIICQCAHSYNMSNNMRTFLQHDVLSREIVWTITDHTTCNMSALSLYITCRHLRQSTGKLKQRKVRTGWKWIKQKWKITSKATATTADVWQHQRKQQKTN
jgi:hypothetical protein